MFSTQSSQSLKSFTEKEYNSLSQKIIECCIEVHKELGPGLMESVYEVCAESVMIKKGLYVQRQVILPVTFKGEKLNKEFVIDTIVNELIILEFKSVETILPVHEAQLVTYLKLADKKLGLLINFNVPLLKDGIRRKINGNLNSV
jgi:GxxExxY protein